MNRCQKIHRFRWMFVLPVFSLFFFAPPWLTVGLSQTLSKPSSVSVSEGLSAVGKIELAYATGRISLDEWARYTAYALFEPDRLPDAFHSEVIEPCGTWIRIRFFQVWPELSEATRQQLSYYGFLPNGALARPTGLDSVRTTAHFKIHYSVAAGDTNAVDSTDANGNGTPDYIEIVMRLLEEVYAQELDSMKYTAPPPDSLENGKFYYDVYIYKLKSSTYGYVQPEKVVGDNPSSSNRVETNAAYSYMALRNNYAGFEGTAERNLKVTIAHEFFHALQNGYDVYEKAWLSEATATWVEDEIYDDINDNYQYLPDWFARPWVALDATPKEAAPDQQHWYGSWIFFRFLSEQVKDRAIVRKIWEHSVAYNSKQGDFSFKAIRDAIADYNKSFSQMFTDFHVANLLKTIPPYHYEEGSNYPDIYRQLVFEPNFRITTYNMRYSADFYEIRLPHQSDPDDEVEIEVRVLDSLATFTVQVVEVRGTQVKVNKFNPRTQPSFTARNLNGLDQLYTIVVNMDARGNSNRYRLEIKRSIELTRLTFGYFIARNPYSFVTRVSDTVRILSAENTTTLTNIQDFEQSPTQNVVALFTKDYDIKVLYNNRWAKVVPDSNLDLSNIAEFHEIASISGNQIWLAGPSIYRAFPVSQTRFRLMLMADSGFGSLSYRRDEEKLLASQGVAVWLDAYWQALPGGDYVYHTDFWRINGQARQRIKHFQSGTVAPIVDEWDFQDSLLVWVNRDTPQPTMYYVSYLNLKTGQEDTFQVGEPPLVKTWNQMIVWSEGRSIFFWNGRNVQRIHQADSLSQLFGAYTSWVDMDSSGIAWLFLESQNRVLIPTFYFYKFSDGKTYSAELDKMNLYRDPSTTIRGDRVLLRNGVIYFTAMEVGSPVQWPSVYALQMRDPIATGIGWESEVQPIAFELRPNYPNPFRDRTSLRIILPKASPVEIHVYDILGRRIYSEVHRLWPAGEHQLSVSARNWGSGVYFYRVKIGSTVKSGKMLIVK